MNQKIIALCKKKYSSRDYNYHILPVVKNAMLLARRLGADLEITETAAYLHDIGRAISRKKFERDNIHHITGAAEAAKILKKFGYEKDFIEKVRHCILAHRGRTGPKPKTIEAKIIACADAMAHFDGFLDLFEFFVESSDSFEDAVRGIESKMQRNWDIKLALPEAKEIVREKHAATMLVIKSMKEFLPEK